MKNIVTLNLKSEFDQILNEYTTSTLTFKILKMSIEILSLIEALD